MGDGQKPSTEQAQALTGLFRSRQFAEAQAMARKLTADFPASLTGWNIRGSASRALGQLDEAEQSFRRLEQLRGDFAGAPYNLALVLADKGDDHAAIAAYRRALAIDPQLAEAHSNLGAILNRQGHSPQAIAHLERACALKPQLAEAHDSLGNALKRAQRLDEARAAYQRALEIRPDFASAHYNLGVLEQEFGDPQAALEALRRAVAVDPGHALARAHLIHQLAKDCAWDELADHSGAICDLGTTGEAVPPFPMLMIEDAPSRQLARARSWAAQRIGTGRAVLPARPDAPPERLRVGYFSADYHDHPGTRLLAGMFRRHDRSRFEVHAFSYGTVRDEVWQHSAGSTFEHFHDVTGWPEDRIVELSRSLGIHVAIDRQGYTTQSRTGLFRAGLAPVQIGYLGYPSTTGADCIDYIVTDPVITPDELRGHYSERLIRLPDTYQPSYDALPIGDDPGTREDHGLPPGALVLCCFNNTSKISPQVFAIWMRVLGQVEGSVLWLLHSSPAAQANLRSAAARRGIDPDRVVFAPRLANADHLARHAHADLFVDTFAYNAHTVAADALWAGLPLITLQGEQFAARVASSLLHAARLPELVTHNAGEYERLILGLAREPARLAALRAKLAENRATAPMFDAARYTRHFEAGLEAAWSRYMDGLPPADIEVPVCA